MFNRKPQRKICTIPKELFDHFNRNDWPADGPSATSTSNKTTAADLTRVWSRHSQGPATHYTFSSASQSLPRASAKIAMHKRPAEHCSGRWWCSWPWEWPGKVTSLSSGTHGTVCKVPELEEVEGLVKSTDSPLILGFAPILEPSSYGNLLHTVFRSWFQNFGQLRNTIDCNLQTLQKCVRISPVSVKWVRARRAVPAFLEKTEISV